jgi:hypothetical protein
VQVSPVTMSHPSPGTVVPPSCLSLGIKDSLKNNWELQDEGFFMWIFDWLLLTLLLAVFLHQSSFLH